MYNARYAEKRRPVKYNRPHIKAKHKKKENLLLSLAKKYLNDFTGGIIKGFGVAIGFTLLGAILIYFIQLIVQWNLPYIGEALGKIIKLAEYYSNGKLMLK